MTLWVYPGSFDPITNGHMDVIKRASALCDNLIVAVLENESKNSTFSKSERIDMIKESARDLKNVKVESFKGLLVDYVIRKNANCVIKGLRAVSDFEYEFQMAQLNKKLNNKVETLLMTTNINYSYLSSSAVKEIAKFKGNIDDLVPKVIREKIKKKYENKL